jgi:phospholipid/cholesterol/gamma-HCH transport system substrate-binding protein
MSTESKGTEFYVGVFLAVGLAFIATMLVRFGGVSKGLTKYYRITVEFPNASGLVNDAQVLLSGARIGYVEETPYLLVREGYGVGVKLKIRDDVKLPRDSRIVVDQSGLLGDCFVDVLPPDKIDPANLIQPGETIVGTSKPGLDALQQKGAIVLTKLADELDEFKTLTGNLKDLVGEQNRKNLSETFEHLKATSANLSMSSKKLDGVLEKGDSAVDSAKKTFESADKAAADLRTAMADFKRVAESTNKTLDSAKSLVDTGNRVLKKAEQGEGALGLLLTDKETAANLKAFAANLKRSGPVFYKDRPPEPTPTPKRR